MTVGALMEWLQATPTQQGPDGVALRTIQLAIAEIVAEAVADAKPHLRLRVERRQDSKDYAFHLQPRNPHLPPMMVSILMDAAGLQNQRRRELLEYIKRNPGASLGEIRRALGNVVPTVAHYHLRMLEQGNLIRSAKWKGHTGYFGIHARKPGTALLLRAENPRTLLQAARVRPGLTVGALARNAGVNRATAYYHIQRLAEAGYLELRGQPAKVHPKGADATP